jgi:hypothetical protein
MAAALRVQLKESDPSEIRRTHNEKQSIRQLKRRRMPLAKKKDATK